MRKPPPKKEKGKLTGPRRIAGELLDVATQAQQLGVTPKQLRAQITRGVIPFRKFGGRVVFIAAETSEFLRRLPGTTLEAALENVAARNGKPGR